MWNENPTRKDKYDAMLKAWQTFMVAYAAWAAEVLDTLAPLMRANADAVAAMAAEIRRVQKQARSREVNQRPRQRRNAPRCRRPPANWYRGGHKDNWIGGPSK